MSARRPEERRPRRQRARAGVHRPVPDLPDLLRHSRRLLLLRALGGAADRSGGRVAAAARADIDQWQRPAPCGGVAVADYAKNVGSGALHNVVVTSHYNFRAAAVTVSVTGTAEPDRCHLHVTEQATARIEQFRSRRDRPVARGPRRVAVHRVRDPHPDDLLRLRSHLRVRADGGGERRARRGHPGCHPRRERGPNRVRRAPSPSRRQARLNGRSATCASTLIVGFDSTSRRPRACDNHGQGAVRLSDLGCRAARCPGSLTVHSQFSAIIDPNRSR